MDDGTRRFPACRVHMMRPGGGPAGRLAAGGPGPVGLPRGPGRPACRAVGADWYICRIAGGVVACWYRVVLDSVIDYRFVRD
jgi:hypothetical protein